MRQQHYSLLVPRRSLRSCQRRRPLLEFWLGVKEEGDGGYLDCSDDRTRWRLSQDLARFPGRHKEEEKVAAKATFARTAGGNDLVQRAREYGDRESEQRL
ncbi:hypothetical protein HPP92_020895 [Vanilla planifolia]|uniref:Uncharacterized protein n=1 Tax=Vanilla planifolia TaxID=51239 RepID=A0A835Q3K3_VANPL|nr:hypothetical protein HPP92_020895 [Vanilla planifolia]